MRSVWFGPFGRPNTMSIFKFIPEGMVFVENVFPQLGFALRGPYFFLQRTRDVLTPGPDFQDLRPGAPGGSRGSLVPWFPWFLGSLWFPGSLVSRFPGSLVPWFPGSLVPWFLGSLVPWFPASFAPWSHIIFAFGKPPQR